MFPKPTADPDAASTNANRDDQYPWIDVLKVAINNLHYRISNLSAYTNYLTYTMSYCKSL